MGFDLLAGLACVPITAQNGQRPLRIGVFDSGLGGLTVHAELNRALPRAEFVYFADDAGFPYGRLPEEALVARVVAAVERLIAVAEPDVVVIACNTASTLALPVLRARFAIPMVGTVPAIKPAAALSQSRLFSVLATPGTVKRDYTRALIEAHAADCRVRLVGSTSLAAMAEAELAGHPVPDAALLAELSPCFVDEEEEGRTDVVVLACTHYPLLRRRFQALAPWPVTFVDPAAAIARRVVQLVGEGGLAGRAPFRGVNRALFSGSVPGDNKVLTALALRGFGSVGVEPLAI